MFHVEQESSYSKGFEGNMTTEQIGNFYANVYAKQKGLVFNEKEMKMYSADGVHYANVKFQMVGFAVVQVIAEPLYEKEMEGSIIQ